jgi:hypothetical protein
MSNKLGRFRASQIILIIPLSFFLFISLALADYHYASHSGSNTYPYSSWETAADSIQNAINSASEGDTIYVGSGLWNGPAYQLPSDLSLIGMGIDSTTLTRDTLDIIFPHDRTLIQGINFNGRSRYNIRGIYLIYTHDVVIKDCLFQRLHAGIVGVTTGLIENNLFLDIEDGIFADFDACTLLVKNNTYIDNSTWCIVGYRGIWTVTNNIFANNPHSQYNVAISIRGNDSGYVANNLFYKNLENLTLNPVFNLVCSISPSMKCENNTFIGPDTVWYQAALGSSNTGPGPLYSINNAISRFHYANYTDVGDAIIVTYSNTWDTPILGGGDGYTTFGEGNLFRNPMFVNIDSGDARLQAFSPLIDAGDPNILDYDGTRSDIGVFGGLGGRFYEYRDLPPITPDSLSYRMVSDSIILNWRMNAEADFNRYIIWRDTIANFTPWAGNIISELDTSYFIDFNWDIYHNYYYKIAAYDNQWNLSGISEELEVPVTSVSEPPNPLLPQMTEIKTNYPNPFNSQTTIAYTLSDLGYQPAGVKLYLYNISGQLVRKLVDTRQYPGNYNVVWDGLGEGGIELSSGIYFARLIVSGIELQRARKLTLLK